MEASASPKPTPGTLALGGISGRDLAIEGPGLMRLALMVGTVFDRMTAVGDKPARSSG
jgi:hypothetical protein